MSVSAVSDGAMREAIEGIRSGLPARKDDLGSRMFVARLVRRFLRHGRALKHGLAKLPRRLLASPALVDDVSSPSSSYPSAGCSSAEPASVSLDKIEALPVCVSLRGPIGRETG